MWRSSHLCQTISMAAHRSSTFRTLPRAAASRFLMSPLSSGGETTTAAAVAVAEKEEVRKLMRLVNVEEVKTKLVGEDKEVIGNQSTTMLTRFLTSPPSSGSETTAAAATVVEKEEVKRKLMRLVNVEEVKTKLVGEDKEVIGNQSITMLARFLTSPPSSGGETTAAVVEKEEVKLKTKLVGEDKEVIRYGELLKAKSNQSTTLCRSSFSQALSMAARRSSTFRTSPPHATSARFLTTGVETAATAAAAVEEEKEEEVKEKMTLGEVRKLMRLVNVEALKTKLVDEDKEVIGYGELLEACEAAGVVRSAAEAAEFAKVLDEAGVVLLFRDRVYLHPDKVVELITSSVPLALTPDDDPRREELKALQQRKEEIDKQAHRQVRLVLWSGLGITVLQIGLFFRLTFWEFSWDVMEPVTFFTTAFSLVIGYGYFMFTSKDPTYRDLMKTIFLSRQRKLFKKHNFDVARFKELRDKCKCPFDKTYVNKNLVQDDL